VMALGVIGFAQPGSSPDEPIYMLLVPSTEGATVEAVGQAIAEAIFDLTGLYVVASLQADYTAMIEAFAASEGDTFGLPTTDQYIRIYERTGGNVCPRLGSVRYGYPWYYASVYARRDSGIAGLEDLDGKVWIYNDTGSTSGYVFPNMVFETAGLEFASIVTTGGHTNSMVALIEGQGDFCTGYGSAPGAPDGWEGDRWDFGDDPELWLWDRWNNALFREAFRGTCYDLRRAVRSTYDFDTVLTDIGVVLNIGPIPNDCLAFGPDFPVTIADQVVDAIKTHIATEEGAALWGDENFYEWTAVADIDDSFYDGYREILGLPIPERDSVSKCSSFSAADIVTALAERVTSLPGLSPDTKTDLLSSLADTVTALDRGDGVAAIESLKTFADRVSVHQVEIDNSVESFPQIAGAESVSEWLALFPSTLIGLGPGGITADTLMLFGPSRAKIRRCLVELATCLGITSGAIMTCGLGCLPALILGPGAYGGCIAVCAGLAGGVLSTYCFIEFFKCID